MSKDSTGRESGGVGNECDAATAIGETGFRLAMELIEKLDPEEIKRRFAMLILFNHILATGQPFSTETMALYLDRGVMELMRDYSSSIFQAMGDLS